jgi:pantoate--beta-alanine ligase
VKRFPTVAAMKATCRQITRSGKTLGLVPTMGALHEGHLSLARASKARCDVTAVSIFVNPLQFGPAEDLDKYPRDLERDAAMLEKLGVELLFVPTVDEMYGGPTLSPKEGEKDGAPMENKYAPTPKTYVLVEGLSGQLDGASRPGHFRGVATVVTKLFEIVRPDYAFFGQKDAAQVAVLRKMVRDLDMDVEVVVCPILREPDGLAMSSRNIYLTPEQRRQALVLHRALMRVQREADRGERNGETLRAFGMGVIAEEPGARLDYFAVVDPESLEPVQDISRGALVAVAAYFGSTRLIDNIVLVPR